MTKRPKDPSNRQTFTPHPDNRCILIATTDIPNETVYYHTTPNEDMVGPFYSLAQAIESLHRHLEYLG